MHADPTSGGAAAPAPEVVVTPGRRQSGASDTSRVELGTCICCGERAYGDLVRRAKIRTTLVEHCTGDEDRDRPRSTVAAAVSVAAAAVVIVCVLLLVVWH
ncbi:hypothetical protein AB0I39_08275 [Kitasatospora purpeofusca]|uniref:hypothetical protein n=1 Tax=Kitasatospora purpeofusca TaxID=67352 RepID=UPI0033C496AE